MDQNTATAEPMLPQQQEITRPIYVRHVPEQIWDRIHENAIKSRLRLSAYLVKVMEQAEPFPPQPPAKRCCLSPNGQPTPAA